MNALCFLSLRSVCCSNFFTSKTLHRNIGDAAWYDASESCLQSKRVSIYLLACSRNTKVQHRHILAAPFPVSYSAIQYLLTLLILRLPIFRRARSSLHCGHCSVRHFRVRHPKQASESIEVLGVTLPPPPPTSFHSNREKGIKMGETPAHC